MTLLNPPDILPEAMRFLLRAVCVQDGMQLDREELTRLVSPPGLVEAMASIDDSSDGGNDETTDPKSGGTRIATVSLDALRNVGLVELNGSMVSATGTTRGLWKGSRDISAKSFAAGLRQVLTGGDVSDEGSHCHREAVDLMHALVLLTTAPEPLRPFGAFEVGGAHRSFSSEQQERLGPLTPAPDSNWPIPNKEQWLPFRRWATYLGLARPVGSTGLIPDCSVALVSVLESVPSGEFDCAGFIDLCSSRLPALDTGRDFKKFQGSQTQLKSKLSPGFSLTIAQLASMGRVELQDKSDSEAVMLDLGGPLVEQLRVTHVKWNGVSRVRKGVS